MNSASSLTQPTNADPRVYWPGEAEEVEPRHIGDTAAMARLTGRRVEDRRLDPRPVRAISRGPDHRIHPEVAAIRERDRSSRGAQSPRLQIDAIAAAQLAWTRPDQCLSLSEAPPNPRFNGLVQEATLVNHQNKSRPRIVCGSGVCREPTARCTRCVEESSCAI